MTKRLEKMLDQLYIYKRKNGSEIIFRIHKQNSGTVSGKVDKLNKIE